MLRAVHLVNCIRIFLPAFRFSSLAFSTKVCLKSFEFVFSPQSRVRRKSVLIAFLQDVSLRYFRLFWQDGVHTRRAPYRDPLQIGFGA